jgi:hypothetical protein
MALFYRLERVLVNAQKPYPQLFGQEVAGRGRTIESGLFVTLTDSAMSAMMQTTT